MKVFYLSILLLASSLIMPTPSKIISAAGTNSSKDFPGQKFQIKQVDEVLETITPKDRKEFEMLLKMALGVSLFEEKEKASPKILEHEWGTSLGKSIMRVYATSFGKPGNKGEDRYFKDGSKVRWGLVAVALPDPSAIGRWVEVRRIHDDGGRTGWVKMKVKDLGPWFRDDPYWRKKSKTPRAVGYFQRKKQRFDGRVVINPAGIDITPWGWIKLGVRHDESYNHSQYVEWRFAG